MYMCNVINEYVTLCYVFVMLVIVSNYQYCRAYEH